MTLYKRIILILLILHKLQKWTLHLTLKLFVLPVHVGLLFCSGFLPSSQPETNNPSIWGGVGGGGGIFWKNWRGTKRFLIYLQISSESPTWQCTFLCSRRPELSSTSSKPSLPHHCPSSSPHPRTHPHLQSIHFQAHLNQEFMWKGQKHDFK